MHANCFNVTYWRNTRSFRETKTDRLNINNKPIQYVLFASPSIISSSSAVCARPRKHPLDHLASRLDRIKHRAPWSSFHFRHPFCLSRLHLRRRRHAHSFSHFSRFLSCRRFHSERNAITNDRKYLFYFIIFFQKTHIYSACPLFSPSFLALQLLPSHECNASRMYCDKLKYKFHNALLIQRNISIIFQTRMFRKYCAWRKQEIMIWNKTASIIHLTITFLLMPGRFMLVTLAFPELKNSFRNEKWLNLKSNGFDADASKHPLKRYSSSNALPERWPPLVVGKFIDVSAVQCRS